jgi:hypothetical protein
VRSVHVGRASFAGDGSIVDVATAVKRAAARHRIDLSDDELVALAARRVVWTALLSGTVASQQLALVAQVFTRLLPAELRAEFALVDPL